MSVFYLSFLALKVIAVLNDIFLRVQNLQSPTQFEMLAAGGRRVLILSLYFFVHSFLRILTWNAVHTTAHAYVGEVYDFGGLNRAGYYALLTCFFSNLDRPHCAYFDTCARHMRSDSDDDFASPRAANSRTRALRF